MWTRIRGPFLMPKSIHHCKDEDWELFDCDHAGCLVCGKLHKCRPGECKLSDNNGNQV